MYYLLTHAFIKVSQDKNSRASARYSYKKARSYNKNSRNKIARRKSQPNGKKFGKYAVSNLGCNRQKAISKKRVDIKAAGRRNTMNVGDFCTRV